MFSLFVVNKDAIQHFGNKHIKKYGNIFVSRRMAFILQVYSMIVEYRKTYLKKWQPLFVTPADYALPFFFLLYYMG